MRVLDDFYLGQWSNVGCDWRSSYVCKLNTGKLDYWLFSLRCCFRGSDTIEVGRLRRRGGVSEISGVDAGITVFYKDDYVMMQNYP